MSTAPKMQQETYPRKDYRDFEQRDLEDDAPYPDGDAAEVEGTKADSASPAGFRSHGNARAKIADSR